MLIHITESLHACVYCWQSGQCRAGAGMGMGSIAYIYMSGGTAVHSDYVCAQAIVRSQLASPIHSFMVCFTKKFVDEGIEGP